jgi:type III secretion system low calcium response chaperone LcrH/SycD
MPQTADTSVDSVARLKEALQALPSSQRLSRADTQAIYALAYNHVAQGHFESAYRYFSLLTLYQPTDVGYLSGLALCYKMLKQYGEALSVYSFLAAMDSKDPQHTLSIVECLLLLGAFDEARSTLDMVVRFCKEESGHEKAGERAEALAAMLKAGGSPA